MPTFIGYKKGEVLATVTGAKPAELTVSTRCLSGVPPIIDC